MQVVSKKSIVFFVHLYGAAVFFVEGGGVDETNTFGA
jgi:hypothetical protein